MNDFVWGCSTKFVFGADAECHVGEEAAALAAKHALVVYGGGSAVRSGLLGRVTEALVAAGIAVTELGGVRPNPEVQLVREGIAVAKEAGVDLIVAVGGGSVIDCAKAIAFGTPYDGDVWDFFSGKAAMKACLPIVCVLTIPAAGSESSSSCVISNDELGLKRGVNGEIFRPRVACMNPKLTFTLPPYQTAAGATDMIAHICERWFSGVGAVPVTDRTAAGLIQTIIESCTGCLEAPENYDARANLMWAGSLAHNGMAGIGRALSPAGRAGGWESHGLEHELSALRTEITHGAGLAVMMPAWMRYVWKADPTRFLDFARMVFDVEPIDETEEAIADAVLASIDILQDTFVGWGMPRTLDEFGLTPDDVPALLTTLEQNKGAVFGAFKKLTMEDARAIYLSAFASAE